MQKPQTESGLKSETKQAVFRYLLKHGEATRQTLFSELGLSLPTIKQCLEYMEDRKLIAATGTLRNTGGRNAATYSVQGSGGYAIGVYLSQRRIDGVCVDLNGAILCEKTLALPLELQSDSYLSELRALVQSLKAEAALPEERFLGVGCAIPSLVSEDGSAVRFGMTSNYTGVSRDFLSDALSEPAWLYHDSEAAGFAEVWKDPEQPNTIYLNLNDSVGSAVFLNGQPYRGSNGLAGELGHVIIRPKNGKRCYCGQIGCFDTLCRAGVLRDAAEGSLTAFFRRLDAGDETAKAVWGDYLDHLALAVHNLRMMWDCELILGGYVGNWLESRLGELYRRVDSLSVFTASSRSYLRTGRYKAHGTAAGAAICVLDSMIETI